MSLFQRLAQNTFGGWFQLPRHFPADVLHEVARSVAAGESTHQGEIRVAIESRLSPWSVLEGQDAHDRAEQLFAHLRVWNTEHNCGVLLYILLAEHRIEIVADRGIAARVTAGQWQSICVRMREHFADGDWRGGLLHGIESANELLREHFPGDGRVRSNELPDAPVVI
jgi:uncharacterized membrane protein